MKHLTKQALIILTFALLIGCQTKAPSKIQDDQALFTQGMHYFEKDSHVSAMDYFLEIKNRFPESPYIKEAKLRLADCYYHSKEYIDAELEYHQFTTLHPLHKDIAYAWLQLGMSQYKQAPKSSQKDLGQIKVAKVTFTNVKRKWPASPEAEKAREMITKCMDKEVEKILYLANFYYRTKKYKVAVKKLEELSLASSTNIEFIGDRNILLARSYIKTNQKELAKPILEALLNNEEFRNYHLESKKYLSKIKADL